MTENAKQILDDLSFCVFDLETTGGNHSVDKIIEIGLVKIEHRKITKKKNFLINPEIPIPEFIQKLTNIKQTDVQNCPTINDVIDEILEFMGDSVLVAHNTSFDVPFFNSVLKRLDLPEMTNKSICTNLMTKYLIPNLLNSNLNYMSKIFGIPHHKAHRALDDAEASAQLLLKYIDIFIEKGITKVNSLYYPRNKFELDRNNFKKGAPKEKILDSIKKIKTPFLITLKGQNGIILFSIPCKNTKEEVSYIQKKIDSCDWELITIKLFGPYLEIFVYYNTLFSKMDINQREEIIDFLWKTHIPQESIIEASPSTKKQDQVALEIDSKEVGDFVVCYHLVPEQYLMIPLKSFHPKSLLVFRYPAHKKKLIQNISSKVNKIAHHKLKKNHYNPQLKEFLKAFIIKEKNEGNPDLLFFSSPKDKNFGSILKDLEQFIDKKSHKYFFPKEYI
ncbi:MAG: PolC-type DNA polymerase III [Bacteriovoracaceae bacterium]